jgi:hypothetical protein
MDEHRYITRSGNLEKSVEHKYLENPLTGFVFLNTLAAPYAIYVHEGTKPHAIFPKNRKMLRWVSGDSFIFAKEVHHPGTEADPFLHGAAEKEEDAIRKRFQRSLRMIVNKAAKI